MVPKEEEEEEEKGRLRMVASKTVSSWAENSSCNGVPNVQRSTHPLRRFCWLVLVLAGTGVTTWQVVSIVTNYLQYPVNVHIVVDFSSTLAFPAITICNANQIRKSALPGLKSLLEDTLPYSYGKNITSDLESSVRREAVRLAFDRKWSKVEENIKFQAGHQKDRMILDCAFEGNPCSHHNFTWFYNTLYGNCYAFNTGWDGQSLLRTHKPGPASGLSLELFVEQEEYVVELTESAGIRVLVHLDDKMPFPEDGSTLLPPGFMTVISMRMTKVTRLASPYPSNCWDMEPPVAKGHSVYSELIPHVDYSQEGCYKTCYQANVVGTCNCGDPSLPLDGVAVRALMTDKIRVINPCQTPEEEICEENVKERAKSNNLNCNCSSMCSDVVFKNTGSQAEWPNDGLQSTYFKALAANNPHVAHIFDNETATPSPRASFLKVQLYYEQLNRELIKEQPAYTVMTLFGDVGGVFGFYLGLSVVAMFEFLELIFDLCSACFKRCLKRGVEQGPSKPSKVT